MTLRPGEWPLWFFWGQKDMTFLRYMTLFSACKIHPDVRLVVREEEIRPVVKWAEPQDFQHRPKVDWMPKVCELPLSIVQLNDVAPEINALRADDVHTSDLLSWWLMATQGGTACDMDIVFLKPLPSIAQDVEIVRQTIPFAYVPIAYMQGRPAEKWMETYRKALAAYNPEAYQSCGGENLKPWPEAALSQFIVYPWMGASFIQMLQYMFDAPHWPPLPDSTIGIHWYAGGLQARNQQITGPEDLKSGAMAWAVKEALR